MSWLSTFLPDEDNRRLFPFFVAFLVAIVGAVVVAVANWLGVEWLIILGGVIVALGVGGGFICVGWGFVTFPREFMRGITNLRERQQKPSKHPDDAF